MQSNTMNNKRVSSERKYLRLYDHLFDKSIVKELQEQGIDPLMATDADILEAWAETNSIKQNSKIKSFITPEKRRIGILMVLITVLIAIISVIFSSKTNFIVSGNVIEKNSYLSRYNEIYYVLMVKTEEGIISVQVDPNLYGQYVIHDNSYPYLDIRCSRLWIDGNQSPYKCLKYQIIE